MTDRWYGTRDDQAPSETMEPQSVRLRAQRATAESKPKLPSMQTLLGHFCEELELNVRPLLEPIKNVSVSLARASELPAHAILPALHELADQFSLLASKMAEQQAYVLIFGPLKSGKSTFMNAICAKYVSEVTCLPAYPCLVQVSHASEARYVVTRYDGEHKTFTDQAQLRRAVESDHRKLAEAIRRCEEESVDFEPQRDAPSAIRRIDVKLPAGELAQSSAVLVDTPGLYSRMKFGYDRMTREFRNAAACAIFVVKTDNLFLDQVFDEFQDLLELFSRIFLIVNLDAAKQDLKPDGSLVPSLEHEDPQAVVRAFESLSMSASLKAARADGRLRIYPVDLLGAASRRIRAGRAGNDRGAIEDEPRGQADFDVLLKDLTDYLNSNEYLKAFVNDSLRRAQSLLDELAQLLGSEGVRALESEVERLADQRAELRRRAEAAGRLDLIDWAQRMQGQREALQESMRRQGEPIKRAIASALNDALEAWFESDASLASLLTQDVEPALAHGRGELLGLLREQLDRRLVREQVLALASDTRRDLEVTGIELDRMARTLLEQLGLEARVAEADPNMAVEHIPVRRSLLDWLLLRTRAAVRTRLLGPAAHPDKPIPPPVKAKRLGDAARDAMRASLEGTLERLSERAAQRVPREVAEAYAAGLDRQLSETLGEVTLSTRERLDAVDARLDQVGEILACIEDARDRIGRAARAVTRLEERFGAAGVQSLAPAPGPVAEVVVQATP
jgi:GTPase SAR1 family protein